MGAVVTVGRDVDPAAFGPQPEQIRIERYVPQESVLPSCDLTINHGGSGSTVGALSFGLPMVIIPLGADQALTAERCEDLGVAILLDAMRLTPRDVRDAIRAVLGEPSYRAGAERIRDEIADLPEAGAAVPLIERLTERS